MAAILIIEDDPTLQEAYSFLLETAGHEITSAYNGKEGIASLRKRTYDIILLDLHMPIMDGWDFLAKYKTLKSTSAKVIVFSNMVEPETKKRALDLGAYDAVLKSSMTPTAMLAMVKEL